MVSVHVFDGIRNMGAVVMKITVAMATGVLNAAVEVIKRYHVLRING